MYRETVAYLDSFINYEKKTDFVYDRTLKLDRMRRLLQGLAIECDGLKAIHVAGTKGKGSTATFCATILAHSGYTVGLYTSPHFFDLRERIKIFRPVRKKDPYEKNGSVIRESLIAKPDVIRIISEFRPYLEALRRKDPRDIPTFFEIYTAMALRYFSEKKVDFAVLETGLGGRLDATNVVMPLVSVLNTIDYDHTHVLGRSISAIAREKAGIIKDGVSVVSVVQRKRALAEIRKTAKIHRSRVFLQDKDFGFKNVKLRDDFSQFDFFIGEEEWKGLKVSMRGAYQIPNAALALAALTILKKQGLIDAVLNFKEGLKNSFIEGRFETLRGDPPVIVDVAHNPAAFKVLGKSLAEYYPQKKIIFVFGAARDKDIKNMVCHIPYWRVVLTPFSNPRSISSSEIAKKVGLHDAWHAENPREALNTALSFAESDKNTVIVVSGSLFLVADVKKVLKEACADERAELACPRI